VRLVCLAAHDLLWTPSRLDENVRAFSRIEFENAPCHPPPQWRPPRLLVVGEFYCWSRSGYQRVVIDEAAFTKDGDNRSEDSMMAHWEKGIKPTLFDYGGEALVCSNSAGRNPDNLFYNICTDSQYGFHEFHATTLNNPLLPKRTGGERREEWLNRRAHFHADLKRQNHPPGLRPRISRRVRRLLRRRILQPREAPGRQFAAAYAAMVRRSLCRH
jgi:hypothetical protein